ncbi:MAG: fumarylacetoacetate hydrolase family protein [Gordonia amarae]
MTHVARRWEGGLGVARVQRDDGPAVILYSDGAETGSLAHVDGRAFSDLPEFLTAAEGNPDRIEGGETVAVAPSQLLSPVGTPRKVICVGKNYLAHLAEGGRETPPDFPDLFPKWDTALAGPRDQIGLPAESTQVDYETELVIVIGRYGRRIPEDSVGDIVFGYTAGNDGSVRDYQFRTSQAGPGKAWDGLSPIGPVVVPADSVGGTQPDLAMTGLLNGEVVQQARTSDMVFGVAAMVSYISTFLTLAPGDLIFTGTPAGVGAARKPPRFLRAGDEFEIRIEGIGSIINTYRPESE